MEIIEEEGQEKEVRTEYESTLSTEVVRCPYCYGEVSVSGTGITVLEDMPVWVGVPQIACVNYHRYRCKTCAKSFAEDIGLKYPGTRITNRAARWITALLKQQISIKAIAQLTGIHWGTIRKIHAEYMEDRLEERRVELKARGYKPHFLAVDEFAIHRGHRYATCVIDLTEGDIIWVGSGRAIKDFRKFFEETDMEYLSDVEAVAMDMNASYNRLVEENMPYAQIVYDRYHVQAQFGKDVLGAVRLAEARQHQQQAREILQTASGEEDPARKREQKRTAAGEKRLYSTLKSSRWLLLTNSKKLSDEKTESLKKILDAHHDLAVCYAMKEELCDLFDLRDPEIASARWAAWFEAAKTSGIAPLVKFAVLKEKRIDGLIAHACFPISTGKLEGLNNKVKVSKRIGYGYRDDSYFFTLIRFQSIPPKSLSSPKVS